MINNEFITIINEIKSRLLLSDIIKKDIKLIKKGKEYIGNCPFHIEKTGSFFVSDEKCSFHCFGCGISGNIFKYIMIKDGITFYQALNKLAEIANIKLPEGHNTDYIKSGNIYSILNIALEYYKHNINKVIDYCNNRGITNINDFHLGFSPNNNDLYDILVKNNFSKEDINKSGLFINTDYSKFGNQKNFQNIVYPRFRNKLMFPIFDNKNRVIAFGGRSIDGTEPKYLNSPETDVFHKHLVLFAFNIASKNVSNKNPFIVVEGYIDVVIMHQYGFKSTVGTMGTALSEDNLMTLWKYCDEPIICLDGDSAGYKAMVKIANIALSKLTPGKSLRFVIIPNNEDPDSYLMKYGKESMEKLINNSLSLIDFIWDYFTKQFEILDKTPEKIALWEQEIYTTLDKISNDRIKLFYKQDIKNKIYNITKQLFYKTNSIIQRNNKYNINNIPVINNYNNEHLNEKLLIYIIIMKPSIIPTVIEDLFRIPFANASFNNIINSIADNIEDTCKTTEINLDYTKKKYSNIINSIINQCSKVYNIEKQTDEEIINYWYYLMERVLLISQENNEVNAIASKLIQQSNIKYNFCNNKDINNRIDSCNQLNKCNANDLQQQQDIDWQRLRALKLYLLQNKFGQKQYLNRSNIIDTTKNNIK